jgi:hypothetical protein
MIELVPVNEPKKKVEILVRESTLSKIDDRRMAFAFRNRTAFLVEAALQYGSSPRMAEVELLADIADKLHQLYDLLHDSGAAPAELNDILTKADDFFAGHMPPRED